MLKWPGGTITEEGYKSPCHVRKAKTTPSQGLQINLIIGKNWRKCFMGAKDPTQNLSESALCRPEAL